MYGNATLCASPYQGRPQFGFHDDADFGFEVREKTIDRRRQIIWQITMHHVFAEQGFGGCATGWRHVGDENGVLRQALLQSRDQRFGRARFANRYCMNPYYRRRMFARVETESLADVTPITGLFAPAPDESQ